jgi:WD40 repeat protein
MTVVFSPDGLRLASGSNDGRIRFWRVDDGALLHEAIGEVRSVRGIAFSADGATLVSVSAGCIVRLWRAVDGQPVEALTKGGALSGIAFSPDLKTIAIGDQHGVIRIYSIER